MARPHKPILSPDLIFRTALEMVDRTGRFTLPELAQRLGVSVSSLYHHIDGRAGIIEGIRALVAADMIPPETRSWPEAVTTWATSYRDAFAAHPAAIPLLVGQTVTDPSTLAQYERLAEILHDQAGLSGSDLIVAITMLDNLCLGAALDLGAPSDVWDAFDRDTPFTRALSASSRTEIAKAAFDRQLRLIVADLARQSAITTTAR